VAFKTKAGTSQETCLTSCAEQGGGSEALALTKIRCARARVDSVVLIGSKSQLDRMGGR